MKTSRFNRRQFLKAAGSAALAPALVRPTAFAADPNSSSRPKPNILMVVADDQRFDTIAALGNTVIKTPNLDRLAKTGFAFTRARTMQGRSAAVCVPSRAQLHSGHTVFRAPGNLVGCPTLGETLMGNGYNAYAGGKWHNSEPPFIRSFHSGRHVFMGGMHGSQYETPIQDFQDGKLSPKIKRTDREFSSFLFTDPAVDFLRSQKGDQPFFCYLAFTSPHDPRTPPAPYDTMYDPAKMPLPDNWLPQHPFDLGILKMRDEVLAPYPRTPEDTRQQLCDYYGMITSQDAQLGRMLEALEQSGQLDNTIVIYTSDHGLSIGSHGLFGKQNCYEEAARIPMLLMGPGIPHGQSDALVYALDLFPTLCEMTASAPPDSLEGKSLTGIMNGKTTGVRNSTYGFYSGREPKPSDIKGLDNQQAVNDGRWKYIRANISGKVTIQLFDLQHDPNEIHDLAQDPAAAKELPRLADLLTHAQTELGLPKGYA